MRSRWLPLLFPMEEWRVITDFPDYQVSNLGRVRRATRGRGYRREFLKPHLNEDGYYRIRLLTGMRYLHRLIADAFIPNPDNKETVDHINRQRTDNRIENLRWATRAEQMKNSIQPLGATGERYISQRENGKFRFIVTRLKISQTFATLAAAVQARNAWMANNPTGNLIPA